MASVTGWLVALAAGGALAAAAPDCLSCHEDASLTMERAGTNVSLHVDATLLKGSPHADLACTDCHAGLNPEEAPHANPIQPVNCLECHDEAKFTNLTHSVHGPAKPGEPARVRCAGCHGTHGIRSVTGQDPLQRKVLGVNMCASCHRAQRETYDGSDHGRALAAGVLGAPTCVDCHGEHGVLRPSDPSAQASRSHEVAMCLDCHRDRADVRDRVAASAGFISGYESSVHGRDGKDREAAAVCSDCHGSHSVKKASDPTSSVARLHIADTCGACHPDQRAAFAASIHGTSLANGSTDAPTCTSCHGEHMILPHGDQRSPTAAKNVSVEVCAPCHASVKLAAKYGLAPGRFESFSDSYHGLAGRAGSTAAANCASCHGVHDILPSSDPRSHIHKDNLAATCGHCHPGAGRNFTKGSVHVVASPETDRAIFWVSRIYLLAIVLIIGGMLIHNAFDFVRKTRRKMKERHGLIPVRQFSPRLYLRMTRSERIQHAALIVSFVTLALTGFALRFPDAWWVAPFLSISPRLFALRGIVHRAAAVVMVAASAYHLGYLAFTARGRRLFCDLWPQWKDATDAIGMMMYNAGLSSTKPKLGRFSYVEKSEYWALMWGTAVMAITGMILWVDNASMNLLGKLGVDIARTVHYYEAWLAVLAIVVWHLHFVMFNPDTYPLNLAFWTGTLTEEEMEHEHPLELEEIHRRERESGQRPD